MTGLAGKQVIVTGASGFVGQALCAKLASDGAAVRRVLRTRAGGIAPPAADIVVEDIGPDTDWGGRLAGADAVVHLAARVHVMRDTVSDPLAAFRRTNVESTDVLARAAARAGVRRFVFVSSVKVNGERTVDRPFTERNVPHPEDAYGRSKWEAEQRLAEISVTTGMAVTILRPPLMYGPGVKGNFLSLMRAVSRGWPLPLASIRNARSLLYVGNLADAVARCLQDVRPGLQTYLLSDGEDVSTPELVRRLAAHLDRPARLLPVPAGLLRLGLRLTGRGGAYDRLAGSLQMDSSAISRELGWRPPHSLDAGLRDTVAWYRAITA